MCKCVRTVQAMPGEYEVVAGAFVPDARQLVPAG